jgi:hypothetical protein
MANLNYSEQTKIYAFVDGLSHKLCEALFTHHLPTTLTGYIIILTCLDNERHLLCPVPCAAPAQQH